VGSQFLGFVFAATAVLASQGNPTELPLLIMPLLFFHFIFDTIFTFCRRLQAGENVTQAHKSHLYQLLNQSGQSHARVSLLHFAITLAQGAGAIVMLQLELMHQWNVFLPFLVFEIIYAIFVMKMARRCGVLDRSGAKSL
jgi:UDP-GlcNAc:undecaprenyl-phosphate GlcNAc-1-phosphate transferase